MLYSPQFAVRSDDDERVTGLDGAISFLTIVGYVLLLCELRSKVKFFFFFGCNNKIKGNSF